MKKKSLLFIFLAVSITTGNLAGCGKAGSKPSAAESSESDILTEETVISGNDQASGKETDNSIQSDWITRETGYKDDGMAPIYADEIEKGIYPITVVSSSPAFDITNCILEVTDHNMYAVMTMNDTDFQHLYMGIAEEAIFANASDYIPYTVTDDGLHTFKIRVLALDKTIPCTAYKKSRQDWFDYTLVFKSDSLPEKAIKPSAFTDPASLDLEDGTYTAEVALKGGSVKASVSSPAYLTVKNGKVTAEITWNSSGYDFMIVDGMRYDRLNNKGNSTFVIPVTGFDYKMSVSANSIATSTPHLILYTLTFDSSTLEKVGDESESSKE